MTIMFQISFLLFFSVFLLVPALSFACTQPNGCKPLLLAKRPLPAGLAAIKKNKQPTANLPDKTTPIKPNTTAQQTKSFYEVKAGDTLYSIGVKNGLHYEAIARWNQLPPSYKILAGQQLKLFDPQTPASAMDKSPNSQPEKNKLPSADKAVAGAKGQAEKTASFQARSEPKKERRVANKVEKKHPGKRPPHAKDKKDAADKDLHKHPDAVTREKKPVKAQKKAISSNGNKKLLELDFKWPINGVVAKSFAKTHHKGIDIASTKNKQPVSAAAAGTVVYQGKGLVGFNNLIIIKHNDEYLSAYANNSRMLVNEGQQVKQGQTIAEISQASASQKPLHFEIRKNGNPVNPLNFLPK